MNPEEMLPIESEELLHDNSAQEKYLKNRYGCDVFITRGNSLKTSNLITIWEYDDGPKQLAQGKFKEIRYCVRMYDNTEFPVASVDVEKRKVTFIEEVEPLEEPLKSPGFFKRIFKKLGF